MQLGLCGLYDYIMMFNRLQCSECLNKNGIYMSRQIIKVDDKTKNLLGLLLLLQLIHIKMSITYINHNNKLLIINNGNILFI